MEGGEGGGEGFGCQEMTSFCASVMRGRAMPKRSYNCGDTGVGEGVKNPRGELADTHGIGVGRQSLVGADVAFLRDTAGCKRSEQAALIGRRPGTGAPRHETSKASAPARHAGAHKVTTPQGSMRRDTYSREKAFKAARNNLKPAPQAQWRIRACA